MVGPLPLPALLSRAFVVFTIEFDNEFEHLMPHRTTQHGSTGGSSAAPWLVSRAMWSHFMRFVDEEGTPLREFQRRAGLSTKALRNWLTRMSKWWGYVHVDRIVTPTPQGRKAIEIWRKLDGVIEDRWRKRFGQNSVDALRQALINIVSQQNMELPESLPILGYGLWSKWPDDGKPREREAATLATVSLVSLVAQVLYLFAFEFEKEAEVSLAISANVVRLFESNVVQVREMPRLAGISKEAVATALSFLGKRGYTVPEASSGASRTKMLKLTPKGQQVLDSYATRVEAIEQRWQARFGVAAVHDLRAALQQLDVRVEEPYADGWRASLPRPQTLPHFPMVLHRGGFPDGS